MDSPISLAAGIRRPFGARILDTAVPGALGGLLFVLVVLGQNLARPAIAPAHHPSAATIVSHFNDHRMLYGGLGLSFAVSGVALALFVASAWARLGGEQG